MPVDLSRAKQIFLDALEQPVEHRNNFIAEQCDDDEGLRQRVMSLVASSADKDNLLDRTLPIAGLELLDSESSPHADHIDQYELLRILGQGGFGVVWLAQQAAPLNRKVALKLLHPSLVGFASTPSAARELIARFDIERQSLAAMDHPNIARVFDAGTVEGGPHEGQPYFVMEYVDGSQIVQFSNARDLNVRHRVELFIYVCHAVQHAHQKGIIHRDIKPSNILVATIDGMPTPKVIDFGVAKAVGESRLGRADLTQQMHVIGTPQYMSPEQAVPGGAMVDTRSDVYMLGAVLYELLTGAPPIDSEMARSSSIEELFRLIRAHTSPRPSERAGRNSSELRGELDWIVMKALEKEPARRYQSAADLGRDLDRYLRNEAVVAGPPSTLYRTRKFVRRHRMGAMMSALVVLAMIVGTAVSLMQAARARRAESDAVQQADRARLAEQQALAQSAQTRKELAKYTSIAKFSQQILTSIDPRIARGKDLALMREVLDGASKRAEEALKNQPEVAYAIQNTIGYTYFAIGDSRKALHHNLIAYDLAEKFYGPDHLTTLHALGNVWPLYMELAQHDQAEQAGLKLLAAYERTGNGQTNEALTCLSNLASLYLKLDRPRDALPLLERAVEGRQKLFGDGTQTFATTNNLALTHNKLDENERAKRLWEQLLAKQRQHLGNDHPQTLATIGSLGNLLDDFGDKDGAEKLLREALEGKRRILPGGHPSRLISEANFGNFLLQLGRHDEAAEIFETAYADALKSVGPDDERRITLTMWVAEVRRLLKRFDGTAPLADDAWQRFAAQFGPTDSRTLQAATTRLAIACDTRNLDDARRLTDVLAPVLSGAPIASDGVAANLFYTAARAANLLGEVDSARQRVSIAQQRVQSLPKDLPLRQRIQSLATELGAATQPSQE